MGTEILRSQTLKFLSNGPRRTSCASKPSKTSTHTVTKTTRLLCQFWILPNDSTEAGLHFLHDVQTSASRQVPHSALRNDALHDRWLRRQENQRCYFGGNWNR